MRTREFLSSVMRLAWQFVKKNGMTMAEAMKVAWVNAKLRLAMRERIVKFYYQKVDGSIREAYGTLKEILIPATQWDHDFEGELDAVTDDGILQLVQEQKISVQNFRDL